MAKTTKTAKKAKKTKHIIGLEEKLLIVILVVSGAMIIAAFFMQLIPTPSEVANADLEEMANDYYLTYLYPRLMMADKDLNKAFEKYDLNGVPTIYLRQLLHYNEGQFKDRKANFQEVGCNTNQTGVRYYPKAPYGPHDYEVQYIWQCSNKTD